MFEILGAIKGISGIIKPSFTPSSGFLVRCKSKYAALTSIIIRFCLETRRRKVCAYRAYLDLWFGKRKFLGHVKWDGRGCQKFPGSPCYESLWAYQLPVTQHMKRLVSQRLSSGVPFVNARYRLISFFFSTV